VLLGRLGAAYVEALTGQRQVLRRAWSAHGGTEMGTEGDSFFVVFPTAPAAVSAAAQAQRDLAAYPWPAGESVRVRIGIHTGSPAPYDGGYVGIDVHRAARISGATHGGQVVISAATAELVRGRLPEGVRLLDLGSHHLKDMPAPERLFQLQGEGLRGVFPPLKTVGAASSLPAAATPLVGRDRELADLAVVGSPGVRLVTLTGPGGSGKTRLALEVARRSIEAFPDGVYFVPLAAVDSAEAMWTSIADSLNVAPEARTAPRLLSDLAHRTTLLVLDNLEQLAGADAVVAELLDGAPNVTVVATSRRPLHLPAEFEYALEPLDLPVGRSLDEAQQSAAVQLFVQQARRVRSGFTLTSVNAAEVTAACRRLDGLPLAIELAASRIKLLSPRALLGRLDAGLDLAATGTHGSSRQRTLRDTVNWSYDLLSPERQAYFRRLGVFAGGADLEAIRAIVVPDDGLGGTDPFDVMADLVDASLVTVAEDPDGEPRFGMLETIHAYARDRLSASGDLDTVRERHALHFVHLVETLAPLMDTERRTEARGRLEVEHDNLREALTWAVRAPTVADSETQPVAVGTRLCKGLAEFWAASGNSSEGRLFINVLIDCLGGIEGPDRPELAWALQAMSTAVRDGGDLQTAKRYATASVAMWRRLDDRNQLATALHILAAMELHLGHPAATRSLLEEAFLLAGESGDKPYLLRALADFAILEGFEHNYERSLELNAQVLRLADELGNPELAILARHNVAESLRLLGRLEEAKAQMTALIPDELRLNEPTSLTDLAEAYAAILTELGDHSRAVKLLGAADRMRQCLGTPRTQWHEEVEVIRGKTRGALSERAWTDAYRSGTAAALEEVLKEAYVADGPTKIA